MLDRRKQQRWPAYWAGQISFQSSQSVCECLIRNTSGGGAKLMLRGAVFVPREFELHIPKDRADYQAKVVWRRSEELGVTLVRIDNGHGQTSAAEGARLRILQREIRALQPHEPLPPMALLRMLKTLRQQSASLRRRLLRQPDQVQSPFDSHGKEPSQE
jgi:PilZ domain